MIQLKLLLVPLLVSCALLLAQTAHYRHSGTLALPDPTITPGTVNHDIEADLSKAPRLVNGIEVNICAKDFRTGPFRKTTAVMKRQVCQEYGAADCPNPAKGEIDHLIPLEIGGQDVIENLWWQPAPDYHVKDHQVEDQLPKLICAGKISLSDAQQCISQDWTACAKRIEAMKVGK